ncbi:MAG TPA: hypothetical protein VL424_14725 [Pararobbsia sp.]|nr:hypothetical protein [Pararobbsia sp.]
MAHKTLTRQIYEQKNGNLQANHRPRVRLAPRAWQAPHSVALVSASLVACTKAAPLPSIRCSYELKRTLSDFADIVKLELSMSVN